MMRTFPRSILLLSLVNVVAPRTHNAEYSKPCALTEFVSTARCYHTTFRVTCDSGIERDLLRESNGDTTQLTIIRWPGDCFDVRIMEQYFPSLREIEFLNCTRLINFSGKFGVKTKIEKVAIHGSSLLWELPSDLFAKAIHLRELDLRKNVLRHLKPKTLKDPPKLERVYLSDNMWDCSDGGLDWLAMERDNSSVKRLITDYHKLTCHQRLYRGKPLHKVMDIIKMVRQTCPEPCACAMTHVVSDRDGAVIPLITVDCADRGLSTAPVSLPPSTTTVRLEGNKISTIRMIIQNPQYKKLADLYLDNNTIPSVKELEGSEWFTTFRVLSLRGNMIKQIPVFAFDKAFQSNNNIMQVFLGQNPWRCDCHYTPRFQALLLKYKQVIRDLPDIRCSKSSDKETSLVQISTMSLGTVCSAKVSVMPISTVNIVNIVLALLILIIVGRFLYDWHSFKKTGKLPWLSSILP